MATLNRTRSAKVAVPGKPKAAAPKAKAAAKSKARPPAGKPEVRIFVSYSHVDAAARQRLETHLAPLLKDGVKTWFDGRMEPGDALDANISQALRQAHVMVALLSPEYISSRYCQLEYDRAMNRRARGTIRVVGVVVRPCNWKATSAAGFKLLPEDGRSVLEWRSADAAYLDVAQGIGKLVKTLRAEMAKVEGKPPTLTAKAKPVAKVKSPPVGAKAKAVLKAKLSRPEPVKASGSAGKISPATAKREGGTSTAKRSPPKSRQIYR